MRYVIINIDQRQLSYRYQQDDDVERFVLNLKDQKVFKGFRNGK